MKEKIKQFLNNPKSHYFGGGCITEYLKNGFNIDNDGYKDGTGHGCGFVSVEGYGMSGDGGGHGAGYCINGRGGNMERRYGGIKYIQLKED